MQPLREAYYGRLSVTDPSSEERKRQSIQITEAEVNIRVCI